MVVSFSLGLALIGKPVMGMLGRDDGPPLVGRFADVTGSYTASFEVCAPVALVGAIASFLCVAPARERLVRAK
jgi:hypothetical protein